MALQHATGIHCPQHATREEPKRNPLPTTHKTRRTQQESKRNPLSTARGTRGTQQEPLPHARERKHDLASRMSLGKNNTRTADPQQPQDKPSGCDDAETPNPKQPHSKPIAKNTTRKPKPTQNSLIGLKRKKYLSRVKLTYAGEKQSNQAFSEILRKR